MKTNAGILKLTIIALTVLAGHAAKADQISSQLTTMTGNWTYAETGLNDYLNPVNDSTDVAKVSAILSGPYTPSFVFGNPNGIDSYPSGTTSTLTFQLNGGALTDLSSLSIFYSQSYDTATAVSLQYSSNNGQTWQTFENTTTGALGFAELNPTVTSTVNIDLTGVQADEFRMSLTGNQVIMHTVTFDGATAVVVPEPSTWALLLGGVGALAFLNRRRKTA